MPAGNLDVNLIKSLYTGAGAIGLLDMGPSWHAREPFQRCALQVIRLSSQDVPTAYAYELEAATIVQPEQVVAAVQRVVSGAAVPA